MKHKKQFYMGEREIYELTNRMKKYVDEFVANETPEESRKHLIRMGVLDDNGDVTESYKGVFV